MAPIHTRQLLAWTFPTIVVLLSYFWFKKKRIGVPRDPSEKEISETEEIRTEINKSVMLLGSSVTSPLQIVPNKVAEGVQSTPTKSFGRSLSGVESSPIDIIIPKELRSSRSVHVVISDEDLDFEIEKVKSMKSSNPIEEFQKARKANSNESIETNNNLEEPQPINSILPANSSTVDAENSKIEMAPLESKKSSSGQDYPPFVDKNGDVANSSAATSSTKVPLEFKEVLSVEPTTSNLIKPSSVNIEEPKKDNGKNDIATTSAKSPVVAKGMKIDAKPFECKNTPLTKINSVCPKSTPKKQKNKNKNNTQNIAVIEEQLNTLQLQSNNDKGAKKKNKPEKNLKNKRPHPEERHRQSIESSANPSPDEVMVASNSLSNISDYQSELLSNDDKGAKKKTPQKNSKSKHTHPEVVHRPSVERDSANHSPDEAMIASHSLSSISDYQSVGSNDSGKGCSDLATPPPTGTPGTEDRDPNSWTTYECTIPITLVGKLIGRRGAFIAMVKSKTNAQIVITRHPSDDRLKVCTVEGTLREVEKAMKMLRDRFPLNKFPQVTLERITLFTHPVPSVPPIDHLHLKLVACVNNDTVVSCMVTPGHLFLQQPTHPTFPGLQVLTNCMNYHYSTSDSPLLCNPIPINTVCAAYSVDSWYRATVLATDEETETSYVKFLDYGGFAYVQNCMLRQMRYDFALLPYQAAECFLANVKPVGGTWADEAYHLISDLTRGCLVFTQVIEYADDMTPLVHCYAVYGPQTLIFLNQELVKRGFAEWESFEDGENCASGVTVPDEFVHEV